MNDIIKAFSANDFLMVLPSFSREYAISLFEKGIDPIDIAKQLSIEPGEGLVTKGGGFWPKDLMPRVAKEVHILLCTELPEYASTREKLKGEAETSANVIVFVISNAIAIHAGMAAALCVPLVALILAAVAKVGFKAWCKAMEQSTPPSPVVKASADKDAQTS